MNSSNIEDANVIEILDPARVIRIIEVMTLLHDHEINPENTPKMLSDIYMMTHATRSPECNENHPHFVTRTLELEESLIKIGELQTWEEPT